MVVFSVGFACDSGISAGFGPFLGSGGAIGVFSVLLTCDLVFVATAVLLLAFDDDCVLGLALAEASETHYTSKYDD